MSEHVIQFRETTTLPDVLPAGWAQALNEKYGCDPERPYRITVTTSKWYTASEGQEGFRADELIPHRSHTVSGQFLGIIDVQLPVASGSLVEEVVFLGNASASLNGDEASAVGTGDVSYVRLADIHREAVSFTPMHIEDALTTTSY